MLTDKASCSLGNAGKKISETFLGCSTYFTCLNTKVLRIGPKSITCCLFDFLNKGQSLLHCNLQVSGCPLNAPVQDLVLPLAYCGHLGSIIALNCGLYGGLPNLDPLPPSRINGRMHTSKAVQACKLLGSFGAVRQQPQPYGRNPSFHTEVGCIIQ